MFLLIEIGVKLNSKNSIGKCVLFEVDKKEDGMDRPKQEV